MSLTKELLQILDDDNEPLPKRLKIADNAFKTTKLSIQNREAVLLNWISATSKSDDASTWSLLLNWLTSQQTHELSRSDVTLKDLGNLMRVLSDGLTSSNNKNIITDCVLALIENRAFHVFFKHDLCNYITFISEIMNQIEDPQTLRKFMKNEHLFNAYLIASDDFPKYFVKKFLLSVGHILERFSDQPEVFLELSAVIEKCLFHRNFKTFSNYFKTVFDEAQLDENVPKLPKLLLKSLLDIFKNASSISHHVFNATFHAFCASYNNNFDLVFKFFILLNETIGFDMANYFGIKKIKKLTNCDCCVQQSVLILSELCHVLTQFNKDLSYKINDISFTDLLKNLTISVISLTGAPTKDVYKFFHCVITVDPLITEQILNDLLVYVMLSNNETYKVEYEKFLISIFEVFIKLHRIPNLISKMIPALKSALEETFQYTTSSINYCGLKEEFKWTCNNLDILPEKVLHYFVQCIASFASWQVINLFKTLLFHFESAVSDLAAAPEDSSKFVYTEIISSLIGQFLCSVRIAEHTTTTVTVEKFVKSMEDLRSILKIFGTTLVKMEHNPKLMRSYLNICHAWGELYVILAYYSIGNEITLQKTLDSDTTACNVTYLHSYLTKDQWRLISQRITNFGEKPCKGIMNKLFIQKLKAIALFENNVNEDVLAAITSGILSSVDDIWQDLLADRVILSQILSNTNCKPVAELLLHDIIKTKNFHQLDLVQDNYAFVCMVLYTSITKINKIFKRQYKNNGLSVGKSLTSSICCHITEDLFFTSKEDSLSSLRNEFVKDILECSKANVEISCSLDDTEISSYLEVIKSIPVTQYNNPTIQEGLILFLISVLLEIRRNSVEHEHLLNKCESIIIGIAQNYSGSFDVLIQSSEALQIIISNFPRYNDLFNHILNNVFKSEAMYSKLEETIAFLTKNIKQEEYLNCVILMLKFINKHKKSKISIENKELLIEYQETIFKSILRLIHKQKNQPDLTEAYALTLKHKLTKTTDEFAELLPFLDEYINRICKNQNNTRGSLLLFTTLLRNKSRIKTLKDDLSLRAWEYCQNLEQKESEECAELVVLIIEHIPNEQFSSILDNLLKKLATVLEEKNSQQIINELAIWNIILSCNLNPIKTQQWQNQLEIILLRYLLPYLAKDLIDEQSLYEAIVKLEVSLIQRVQHPLTPLLIDAIFLTLSMMTSNEVRHFQNTFVSSFALLQALLKFRKSQMMDYLPVFLQRYRTLLKMLCIESNANLKLKIGDAERLGDCAHKLEKLTNNLVTCNKHLMRIAPYLIADILKQYEEITLLPNVKLHLNNCLYGLSSLCDEHAVSYLLRILSTASTEMFKIIYENYKKYYKFTGKV